LDYVDNLLFYACHFNHPLVLVDRHYFDDYTTFFSIQDISLSMAICNLIVF